MSGLQLEPQFGLGIRAGLESALRRAIRTGRLQPGTRLPSSRAAAVELGVARNTIGAAYSQLVSEGYLVSDRGAGTRVAAGLGALSDTAPAIASDRQEDRVRYDLRPCRPDLDLFPHTAWLAANRRALAHNWRSALDYDDPRGPLRARETIAAYLARVRGVVADPDQILLCAGYRHAVALVAATLRGEGIAAVAVERPGLPEVSDQVTRAGMQAIPIEIDKRGARVHMLADSAAQAVVLTPAHQFPTGVVLSPDRREALIDWAHRSDGFILEDDYDAEFRYDRPPIAALQGLAPGRVIYAGSVSKTLAPGLRLGWIVVPRSLRDQLIEERRLTDSQPPSLDHLALAELIDSGAYERHIRRARLHYRRRRDSLAAALPSSAARLNVDGMRGGLHALLWLPEEVTEPAAVKHLAEVGVAVNPLARYGTDLPHGLVVGYGTPPQHAWQTGLALLVTALESAKRATRAARSAAANR